MARFTVRKDETFKLWIAFNVRDPENPEPIFNNSKGTLGLWEEIQANKDHLELHYCELRRPGWALDSYLRELALTPIGENLHANAREFSAERMNEVRVRYLLVGISLLENFKAEFTLEPNGYMALDEKSYTLVSSITPVILRMFTGMAGLVLDNGINPKTLFNEVDFEFFKANAPNPESVETWSRIRGYGSPKIVDEAEAKKKSMSEPPSSTPGTA